MRPRLIASDLDGTLLDHNSSVSAVTRDALRRAAADGIEIVVATGRSHWSALPLIEPLGCVRWMICSNGATVFDLEVGEVVLRRPIEPEMVDQTIASARAAFPEVGIAGETPDGLFYSEVFVQNRRSARPGASFGTRSPSLPDLAEATILKLMLAHPSMVQISWLDALAPHLPTSLSVTTSGADFVEVCAPDADKGVALSMLCDELGVSAADVVAFGDHSNDLGMLSWAGRGYVMANAHERARAASPWSAPPHHQDGVAQVVDALLG